jgi:hypothetical protein
MVAASCEATDAVADATPRRFVYRREAGTEACPSGEDIRSRVLAHLGYDPFAAAGQGNERVEQIALTITRVGMRVVARIERTGPSGAPEGTREFASASGDCDELASTAAFAVAFAVDPLHARDEPLALSAPTETAAQREPPAPPPPMSREAPVPAPLARREPLRLRLGASALGLVGAEPSPTVGASGLVGAAWTRWSLDLEGRGDLAATTELARGGTIHVHVLAGALIPCVAVGVLRGCAIGSIGVLRGRSEGLAMPAQADSLWAAAGLRMGMEVPVGGAVKVRALGELQGVLTRTTLETDGVAVWTTSPLAAAFGLGAVVELR